MNKLWQSAGIDWSIPLHQSVTFTVNNPRTLTFFCVSNSSCTNCCVDYGKIWATAALESSSVDALTPCFIGSRCSSLHVAHQRPTGLNELLTLERCTLLLSLLTLLFTDHSLVGGSAAFRHNWYWLQITLRLDGQDRNGNRGPLPEGRVAEWRGGNSLTGQE